MDLEQIEKLLSEKFNQPLTEEEERHIIFWYDAEGDFAEDINRLQLDNAEILTLTDDNKFATKYKLEVQDQQSNYLVYADYPQPDHSEDWLLDISSYADDFTADKTTIIMKDFGVEDRSLRALFKEYKKFFNNQRRYKRLLDYDIEDYTKRKLDIGIISALCKLKAPDLEVAVKKILMDSLENEDNELLTKIKKFGKQERFWSLVANKYHYLAEEKDLQELMTLLAVTNLEHDLNISLPEEWSSYLSVKDNNCIVFIDHWMNHNQDAEVYNSLSREIESKLNLAEYIEDWELEDFLEADTFKGFDRAIIKRIVENLLEDIDDFDRYQEIISLRRTKHWYSEFEDIYEAIYWAVELLKQAKEQTISQSKAADFFKQYTEEYYLFDKAYRKFNFAYDKSNKTRLLRSLQDKVENLYTNSYLQELSLSWSNTIEDELKESWPIKGITQQQSFYQEFIADNTERTFVIISDALRYEAAQEFSHKLNNRLKGTTELHAMQGSLPSYTKLGMASLLPHKELELDHETKLTVDGSSSQGLNNRQQILAAEEPDSTAITYDQLIELNRSQLRDRMKGKQVVYIYHNEIDAKGDHAATERETFSAVENTFTQLDTILRILKNGLSATHVYITADHGFIYRKRDLESSDKTDRLKSNLIERKRRFIISEQESEPEGTLSINLEYIFGSQTKLRALVPRGVNRFTLQGPGQNFVHGGAALQEIVIPVIKFRNDRSNDSDNEVNKVEVKLTSITREITNNIFYLEFFQAEKIAEKLIPRRLKLYFADEAGDKISNENIIIADINSSEPNQRSFKEKFTLQSRDYRRDDDYYLVMVDQENSQIYKEVKFSINLL